MRTVREMLEGRWVALSAVELRAVGTSQAMMFDMIDVVSKECWCWCLVLVLVLRECSMSERRELTICSNERTKVNAS